MKPKVIVITGASSEIGATLAGMLAKAGHKLVLAARRDAALREVADGLGKDVAIQVADVTRRAEVEQLRERALAIFDHVDVWINNAGRGIVKPVLDLTDDEVDEIVAVNLKSALYGMQAIVPHFQERGRGHLINVSSFLSMVPIATVRSIYSASKAALYILTANLRMDLKPQYPEIFISTVMPGMVATEFHTNALGAVPNPNRPANAPPPQTADEVAEAMVELIRNPKSEIYTNPALAEYAQRYVADVGAFEDFLMQQAK